MEVEAITRALNWIKRTRSLANHAVVVTDSQSALRKIEQRWLRTEWLQSIKETRLQAITWIFCPGHAGVKGNEAADNLAGQALIENDIKLDKAEVLKLLTEKLREEEETTQHVYHGVERMKELNKKKGEGRKSQLSGRMRRIYNQLSTGTISVYTLQSILKRGTEHVWVCPECDDVVPDNKV